jgi:hypothetical protein
MSRFREEFRTPIGDEFPSRVRTLAGVRKSPKNEPAVSRSELWGFVVLGEAVVAEIEGATGDGAPLWGGYSGE